MSESDGELTEEQQQRNKTMLTSSVIAGIHQIGNDILKLLGNEEDIDDIEIFFE
jgi:hypothetical protein